MKLVIEQDKERVADGLRDWCICGNEGLKTLFEQWVVKDGTIVPDPTRDSRVAKGVMGHDNQYSRLTGIDFGVVHKNFVKAVHAIANNSGGQVTMELAVEGGVFMVYFMTKSTSSAEPTYWGSDVVKSHLYSVAPVPHRSVTPRLGVSTDLRNQLIANWVTLPFFMVSDLFNSMYEGQPVGSREFNRNRAWIRTMRYNISGDNLTAFNDLLKGAQENKGLRLRFGANLSDAMLGEDVFTMVIEVDDAYVSTQGKFILNNVLPEALEETTYLEYVGGCPPLC